MVSIGIYEKEILVARVDILTTNLIRVVNLLRNEILSPDASKIRGKFSTSISELLSNLETLKKNINSGSLGPERIARDWDKLEEYSLTASQIHSQCLDFLGGLAAQRWKLDADVCALSEKLVAHIADKTGVTWGSVMILGEERPIDDIAEKTQIIRIRFPEWDIWSLPFIAYEYGKIIARSDSDDFKDLFEKKKKQITELIEKEIIDDLSQLGDDFLQARNRYQDALAESKLDPVIGESKLEDVRKQTDAFIRKISSHLRSLFGDILATYFMGPAYLYACIYLRLVPDQVDEEGPSQPSLERRIAFIFETLKHMNEVDKPEELANGFYDEEINRFKDLWMATVKRELPNDLNGLDYKEPYDSWFDECFHTLRTFCRHEGFEGIHWNHADVLARRIMNDLPEPPDLLKDDTLPVILNAAWICRKNYPDKAPTISDVAYPLCLKRTQVQSLHQDLDKTVNVRSRSSRSTKSTM